MPDVSQDCGYSSEKVKDVRIDALNKAYAEDPIKLNAILRRAEDLRETLYIGKHLLLLGPQRTTLKPLRPPLPYD